MAGPYILLVTPTIHETTLIIMGVSAYFVLKQKMTYPYVKNMLFLIHIFFMGTVLLELLRDFIVTPFFMQFYTIFGTSFILWDIGLVLTIAYVVYFRPTPRGVRHTLASILSKQPFGVLYVAYIAFLAFDNLYLAFASPYFIVQLHDLLGAQVTSTAFTPTYLTMQFVVLITFMIFPTGILAAAARATKDPSIRHAMILLPITWTCIGVELLFFNGYLIAIGIDASAFGYLIAAAGFTATAAIFRRATILASFFEVVPVTRTATKGVAPFSSTLGLEEKAALGRNYLLEVDPATNYEVTLKDFALELVSDGCALFIFTSRGSPVHSALETVPEARFYLMTSRVSYPKVTEKPSEVLVPMNDIAVLLDVLDKTIASGPDAGVGIIFDTISDLIISAGFESTFKFVKQANEILSGRRATSLFLLTAGAHDEKMERLIKNLFGAQLAYSSTGLAASKYA